MSVVGSNVLAGASGQSAGGGAGASRSLRFNSGDTAYLERDLTSAGNQRVMTFSFWVKKNNTSSSGELMIAGMDYDTSGNAVTARSLSMYFGANTLKLYDYGASNGPGDTGSSVPWYPGSVGNGRVFRDPAAWTHCVFAIDTTQATAADRCKIWINGESQTHSTPPTQNIYLSWGQARKHYIGIQKVNGSFTRKADLQFAEFQFIEGQQLAATNFGEYNTDNLWIHKAYDGTYGTNGFYLDFSDNSSAAALGTDAAGSNDWTVHNLNANELVAPSATVTGDPSSSTDSPFSSGHSVDFDGNDSIKFTGPGTVTGDLTVECFYKMNSSASGYERIFSTNEASYSSEQTMIRRHTNGNIQFYLGNGTPEQQGGAISVDTWYHAAMVYDRSASTVSYYIDGSRIGTDSYSSDVPITEMVAGLGYGSENFHGKISNCRVTKQALYSGTSFTVPTSTLTTTSQGATGSNVVLLCCHQNSTTTVEGAISVPTSIDSLVDHPTNGDTANDTGAGGEIAGCYATYNPLIAAASSATYSNGNLDASSSTSAWQIFRTSIGVTSGKWLAEYTTTGNNMFGIDANIANAGRTYFNESSGNITVRTNGTTYIDNSNQGTTGSSISDGSVVGLALDLDSSTKTLKVYINGSLDQTINLTSNFNNTEVFFAGALYGTATISLNCGQRAFAHTVSGYKSLNTANLPTPTVADGSKYFDTKLYTGNGSSSRSITMTNSTLSPDFVWIKKRNSATDGEHMLYDIVRGAGKFIRTEGNFTEQNDPSTLSSFNSNGFSLGNDHQVNKNNDTYVSWNWDAGSSTVTNNDGSISSQVRANPTAGFSCITYTGTGSNATVGHGLNAKPSFYVIKGRLVGEGWMSYWSPLGATKYMEFSESTVGTSSNRWNDTEPTNSVFSIGTEAAVNTNNQNFVCYCFSSVEGYSSVGKYSGKGGSVGPFVYTGFAPVFVILKSTSHGTEWCTNDIKREENDPGNARLSLDKTRAEVSDSGNDYRVDFLSNGFQLRGGNTAQDYAGRDYIYIAFASHPFQTNGGLAR